MLLKKSMVLMLLSGLALALAACAGEPRLELENTMLELGEVVNGEIASFDVILQNRGSAPLQILDVSTSCGCTTASVTPASIAPGARGLLEVHFDSGAHGPEANGPVRRTVIITSNDPAAPEIMFVFSAIVVPADGS